MFLLLIPLKGIDFREYSFESLLLFPVLYIDFTCYQVSIIFIAINIKVIPPENSALLSSHVPPLVPTKRLTN